MEDQKKVFSEVIKRQMAILGPDITFAKVRNVPGIQIDAVGNVTALNGDPQALLQQLINQFVELSGLIVKKTMESILSANGVQATAINTNAVANDPQASQVSPRASNPNIETPTDPSNRMASANKDLEDLNKMLDSLGNTASH